MAINWLKNTNTLPEIVKTVPKMSPNLLPTVEKTAVKMFPNLLPEVVTTAKKIIKTSLTPEERAEGLAKAFAQKEDNIKAKTAFSNKGMSKADVMKLQQDLVDAGYGKLLGKDGVDGKWGAKSQAALEAFQKGLYEKPENKMAPAPMLGVQGTMKNWLKKGGTIENTRENVAIPNLPKKAKSGSKIYIKPENKGKFTATKKKTGKSTEELTHSKNPLTKKRAIFAQNSKKWHHKDGGIIQSPISIINNIINEYWKV